MGQELSVISDIVDNSAEQFVSTLAQYQWSLVPDSQLQAAKQALKRNDYIEKIACQDREAVHDALINAAVLGLDLTEGKRQGWLIPRKNQKGKTVIALQVGYKGVEAIHQRAGVIDSLSIRVVRENDIFDWSGDDEDKPKHQSSSDGETPNHFATDEERGAPSGAFAITYYPSGKIKVTVTPIETIYTKHRDRSDAWKGYQKKLKDGKYAFPPPWISDEKSMIEKTMAYIASKQWPANIRDDETASKILETLHQIDTADYALAYTSEQKMYFDEIVAAQDALGMWLFQRYYGMDIYYELYSRLFTQVPRGQKGKEREKYGEWASFGDEMFFNIKDAVANDDIGLLHENLEDISEIGKKMLVKELGREDGAVLVSMMESSQ